MKKLLTLMLTGVLVAGTLTGCGSSNNTGKSTTDTKTESTQAADSKSSDSASSNLSGTITAAGSSALKPLVDDAANSFIKDNPNVSITVDAGGSGEGLKQVAEGTVTIGNSDVAAADKLDADKAKDLVDHQVCVITMAPIVNQDVKDGGVKSLTTDQLIAIFTGKTTNWKDVGGPDEKIVLVTRPDSSGTRSVFTKYALNGNKEASNTSMETDDSGVLLQNVKGTKGAIGYVALSYLTGSAGVATVSIDGVEPTLENTYSGKYKVWSFEHMYTKGEAKDATKAFLDYISSDKYGSNMEKLGYGVASKMTVKTH